MVVCSPFGPAGELAASRHGALTRTQAASTGMSDKVVRRLLRDRLLTEPVPGVLVVRGSPATWRQRLYVATLASKGAGVAGCRSAAALLGADGYSPGPIELLVTTGRRIDLPELVIRRGPLPADDLHEVDGIACTNIARTLCDLGTHDPLPRLRLAFEWAWRSGCSLTWIEQTARRLEHPRRRGAGLVLGLVDEARRHDRPTESALEAQLDAVLTSLPGVVRQHTIVGRDGRFVARVDFAIPELRIAIEAHSRRFHFGIHHQHADADREAAMHAEGWIVRYVTDAQRRRPDELRASLLALVTARLPRPA